jgi:capsid protein
MGVFQKIANFFRKPAAPKAVVATYDSARTSDENRNHWLNADTYDADSAHSRDVRLTLIHRSRYEIANNPYAAGIAQTYATDLISTGPILRMQTGSQGFNELIELSWYNWCRATGFSRKLWCMAHAKYSDGESFGVIRRNKKVNHPMKIDLVLHEAEQIQSPFEHYDDDSYIDGIKFDQFGNPLWYDLLYDHPGATTNYLLTTECERIPADRMLHWFKMTRPGQHRAVPEWASAMSTGAAGRRWLEATIAAAETAADLNVIFHTNMPPDQTADAVQPFSTIDLAKRMGMMAPMGWDASHFKSEHPNATFDSFNNALISAMARAVSMPANKAMCNSANYNYASGRLDHQTYYAALDVERDGCTSIVLDPLFAVWFDLAIATFGWLGGNPDSVSSAARAHLWDWPKHRVADVEAEANASETKLKSGQVGLHQLYTDAGMDLEDEIPKMATTFGVDESVIRSRLLDVILPPPKQLPQPQDSPAGDVETAIANLNRRGLLTNGVHHAN